SSRPTTVAPGAAAGGSSVRDHFTRSFWAKAGRMAAHSVKKTTRQNREKKRTDTFSVRITPGISANPRGGKGCLSPFFRGLLNHDALQFIFNPPVYIFARKFGGHTDGVFDGIRVRPPMAVDADALHAQQRCAAIFRV